MIRRVLALLFFLLITLATLMLVFLVWPTTPSNTAFTGIVPTLTPFYDPTDEAIVREILTMTAQAPTRVPFDQLTPPPLPPRTGSPVPPERARYFDVCPADRDPAEFDSARRAGDGVLSDGGTLDSSRFLILTTWYAHKGADRCVFVKTGIARIEGQPDTMGHGLLYVEEYTNDGYLARGGTSLIVDGGTGGVRIIDADGMRLTLQTQQGLVWFDVTSNTVIGVKTTPTSAPTSGPITP